MILQTVILFIVETIFDFLILLLPDINLEIPQSFYDNFHEIFSFVKYFLPIKELIPLIIVNFAFDFLRLMFAIFSRVKSLIPTMGD